jgi:Purple acid Phosphatase, N-terminal domain/Calcineurin-like phosphoesterase
MARVDRRRFLETGLGGMALALGAGPLALSQASAAASNGKAAARPDTLFLTWQRDPTTTMTVQWIGKEGELTDSAVAFAQHGKNDWQTVAPRITPYPMSDLKVFRAELTGLTPGSEYRFRIGPQSHTGGGLAAAIGGQASTLRFRTMPAKATNDFQFVSGGDCGVNEHAVKNNIIAARQDPMFALIGGDLGYDNGVSMDTSLQFMRNYSQNMIDAQGRLIPMVVCIGNHEVQGGSNPDRKKAPFYFALHDGLYAERSFATLDFGDYLSLVLLDSGHVAPFGGEQADWLDKALADRTDRPHLFAVNHVPAYPSARLYDYCGVGNRKHWVPLFEKHNVDVVLEHHDHTFKRSFPLKDGLKDPRGILYLGDGSWGKLRALQPPEKRPYLAAASEAYHLSLHRLEGEQRFHMAIREDGKIIDVCTSAKKARKG